MDFILGSPLVITSYSIHYTKLYEFFGLAENPFSLSPNPKYCYMSERHTEALAHLSYGLQEGGGFVLLTGEVGTGKTTVSRCLRRQLDEETQLAVLHNPTLGPLELLQSLCDELQLAYEPEASLKGLFDRINRITSYNVCYTKLLRLSRRSRRRLTNNGLGLKLPGFAPR